MSRWSFIFYHICCFAPSIFAATPIVNLTYAQYQGVLTLDPVNNESITQFLGIRYAAAPTGKASPCFVSVSFTINYFLLKASKNRILEIQRAPASFVHARRSTSEQTAIRVFSGWNCHCSKDAIP